MQKNGIILDITGRGGHGKMDWKSRRVNPLKS